MQRTGRIIYNGAMVVSLLLCLGTVGVWVRSYWVSDTWYWARGSEDGSFFDQKSIDFSRGGTQFTAARYLYDRRHSREDAYFGHQSKTAYEYPAYGDRIDRSYSPRPRRYAGLGFEWIPQTSMRHIGATRETFVLTSLTLPLYFPTLLFALLPAHYFLRVRRRRRIANRRAQGCCIFCGYDLRSSPARCPECGREAEQEK